MISSASNRRSAHLWFQRSGKLFAVPMEYLQEVIPVEHLRPLPAAEPALAGLMTLRERVVPVLEPLSLAGYESAPITSPIVIVIAIGGTPIMGLLAESVGKVVELAAPLPLTITARLPEVFAGEVGGDGKPRLLVINAPVLAAQMGLVETPSMAAV
jgi:purine-binding chemotaxis protein CheW